MTTKKRKTTTATMKKDKKVSQLWYAPEDYEIVKAAAKCQRRPMTTFAILCAVAEAKRVIMMAATDAGMSSDRYMDQQLAKKRPTIAEMAEDI